MRYRIGLDFGASATKVAYLDEKDRVRLFYYPGSIGSASAPTMLTCHVHAGKLQASTLGAVAESIDRPGNTFVCEHFKPILTMADDKQRQLQGWSFPVSPIEVTRAYFHHLLWENPHSFTSEIGPIESMAVAAPESWRHTPHHAGPDLLKKMFPYDFSLANVHLHSEAVCAATYLSHCYKQAEGHHFTGSLLICDMGGSDFVATLCRVRDQHVEVLASEGGQAQGIGLAGIAFDHHVVAAASTAASGGFLALDDKNFRAAVREFTTVKEQEHENVQRLLDLQATNPELSDTPVYVVQNKYTVDINQVRQSFQPIAENMKAVLTRLLARAEAQAWSVDYLAPVGGFAQYPLVQNTLRSYCGPQTSLLSLATLQGEEAGPGWEIACGAALLAQSSAQKVKAYYPHTLGIFVHRREKGALVETFLPCIEAGTVPLGQSGQYFVYDKGRTPVTIEVARQGPARLPVYVRWRGAGEPQALPRAEVEYPAPGAYHFALAIDSTQQVSVQFQPIPSGKMQTYPLGSIYSDFLMEGQ